MVGVRAGFDPQLPVNGPGTGPTEGEAGCDSLYGMLGADVIYGGEDGDYRDGGGLGSVDTSNDKLYGEAGVDLPSRPRLVALRVLVRARQARPRARVCPWLSLSGGLPGLRVAVGGVVLRTRAPLPSMTARSQSLAGPRYASQTCGSDPSSTARGSFFTAVFGLTKRR